MLESLDPGCDGKLLVSKLTSDEIPLENYTNLKEFIDTLDASDKDDEAVEILRETEDCSDGPMEEWPDGEGGVDEEFDWSNKREKFSSGHHVDIGEDDDGIQVRGLTCWLHISDSAVIIQYDSNCIVGTTKE